MVLDPKKLLEDFLGPQAGGAPGGQAGGRAGGGGPATAPAGGGLGNWGGLATGAAAGGLVALLLGSKKARKIGGKVVGYGGAAVLGGLAYKAWQDWSARRAAPTQAAPAGRPAEALPPPPPAGSAFDLAAAHSRDGADARIAVVRAMIAAAKADGHIDAEEQRRLFQRIGELQLDPEEKAFVMDELAKPGDAAAIAALAAGPEQAAELWLASRLAIDPDDAKERAYLDELARRMELPADLVAHLEARVIMAAAEDAAL